MNLTEIELKRLKEVMLDRYGIERTLEELKNSEMAQLISILKEHFETKIFPHLGFLKMVLERIDCADFNEKEKKTSDFIIWHYNKINNTNFNRMEAFLMCNIAKVLGYPIELPSWTLDPNGNVITKL